MTVLYIVIVLKNSNKVRDERLGNDGSERPQKKGFKALFNISNITDGFKVVLQERPNNQRIIIFLTFFIALILQGVEVSILDQNSG